MFATTGSRTLRAASFRARPRAFRRVARISGTESRWQGSRRLRDDRIVGWVVGALCRALQLTDGQKRIIKRATAACTGSPCATCSFSTESGPASPEPSRRQPDHPGRARRERMELGRVRTGDQRIPRSRRPVGSHDAGCPGLGVSGFVQSSRRGVWQICDVARFRSPHNGMGGRRGRHIRA